MEKHTRQLLSAAAYERIKRDIVTCALDPGQFIAQADLAARYAVGVTPVREALRQLAQEGFVVPVPRLGYIVSLVTGQDVQEIYENRLILETAAVRLAAERAPAGRLEELAAQAGFTYTYKDRASYTAFLERNADFHRAIAAAAGNRRLADLVSRVLDELNRVFHLGLDVRDSAGEMTADHLALAAALRRRDAVQAEALVRSEILRSRERVLEALLRYDERPISAAGQLDISLRARGRAES